MEKPACLLVHNSKDSFSSQEEKKPFFLQVYHKDLKVKVPFPQPPPKGGARQKIFEFSDASKRRLLHVCRNSGHLIKSQFLLTYHEFWPEDGKRVKAQLNHFITVVKNRFGRDLSYLWCLEFQDRGAPHIHFYSGIDPSSEAGILLANIWALTVLRLQEDSPLYRFHSHPSNFMPWNMKSGSYLAKEYLAKAQQKSVPEEFQNVGRFWGNSRNMIPPFTIIDPETLPGIRHEIKKAVRQITKAYERISTDFARVCRDKIRHIKGIEGKRKPIKRRNYRAKFRSYTVPLLSGAFAILFNTALFGA